jgi:hypothetical protein
MTQVSNAESIPLLVRTAALMMRSCRVRFPGRTRVGRRLVRRSRRAQNISIRALGGFQVVVPNIREPIGFYLFIDGEYETDTHCNSS